MSKPGRIPVFKERFKRLFRDGETQEQFAQRVGLNRNTVAKYASKELTKSPDSGVIIQICQQCNVSADWLLGISDVRMPDPTLKAACEYTGLSEKAIEMIRDMKLTEKTIEGIRALVSDIRNDG